MCEICGGSGYIFGNMSIPGRNGTEILPLRRVMCKCKIWEELGRYYPQLSADFPDDRRFLVLTEKLSKPENRFLIFFNCTKRAFYESVKVRLLNYKNPFNNKLIINSNDFVERYYLPKEDFSEKRISDCLNFDHIFITFDSGVVRPSASKVLSDLIDYRVVYDLPIWISIAHDMIVSTTEYGQEMHDNLEHFRYFNIKTMKFRKKVLDNSVNSKTT